MCIINFPPVKFKTYTNRPVYGFGCVDAFNDFIHKQAIKEGFKLNNMSNNQDIKNYLITKGYSFNIK